MLGTWEGSGRGEYPTIDDFAYLESITFSHVGKPFVAYTQRTRHPEISAPMHSRDRLLRVPRPGSIEIVMAQPTGPRRDLQGARGGWRRPLVIDARSTSINATPSAKEVTITERTISVTGDDLHYTFRMAAVGQPLQHHLSATLRRVG